MKKSRNSKFDSFPKLLNIASTTTDRKQSTIIQSTRTLSKLHYKKTPNNLNLNTLSKPLRSSLITHDAILSYTQIKPSYKQERLNIKKTLKARFNSYDFIGYIPDFDQYDHLLGKNTAVEYYFPKKVLRIMDYLNHQPARIREIYRVMNLNSNKVTRNICKGTVTYSIRPKEKEKYLEVQTGNPMLRKAVRWQNMKFLMERKSVQMDILIGKFPAIKDYLNGNYLVDYKRFLEIMTLIGLSKESNITETLYSLFTYDDPMTDCLNFASMVVEIELCRRSSYMSKIKGTAYVFTYSVNRSK